jgi:hypothetical protein
MSQYHSGGSNAVAMNVKWKRRPLYLVIAVSELIESESVDIGEEMNIRDDWRTIGSPPNLKFSKEVLKLLGMMVQLLTVILIWWFLKETVLNVIPYDNENMEEVISILHEAKCVWELVDVKAVHTVRLILWTFF